MPGPGGKEVGRLSLKVLPDTSEFSSKLKAFAERVEKQVKIKIPVHLDVEQAMDDIARLQARMDAMRLDVPVNVDLDGGGARIQMVVLINELNIMAKRAHPTVEVDVDSGAALGKMAAFTAAMGSLSGATGNAGRFGRIFLVLLPLVLGVGSAIAALGPSLAAAIPLAGALAASGIVMFLGWKQFHKVLAPIIQSFKNMRAAIGNTLTAGLAGPFKNLAFTLMPALRTGFVQFAQVLNSAFKQLAAFFNAGPGVALVGQAFKAMAIAAKPFAALLPAIVEMILRLAIAAAPAMRMMGTAILGAVTKFNKFLASGKAAPAITNAMRMLGQTLSVLGHVISVVFPPLVKMFPFFLAVLKGVGSALGTIFGPLGKILGFFGKYPTVVGAIAAGLTALAVVLGVVAAAMAVLTAVMNANVFVLVAAAIAALVVGIIYAYKHSEKFRNIVQTIGGALKSAFIAVLPGLKNIGQVFVTIGQIIGKVIGFIIDHWKVFLAVLAGVGLVVLSMISPFLAVVAVIVAVVALIIAHWSSIKAFFVAVWAGIVAVFTTVWTIIKTVITTAITVIGTLIRVHVLIWKTIFVTAFNAIKTVIQVAWAVIQAIVAAGVAFVASVMNGIRVIVAIWRAAFNAARAVVSAVIGAIRSIISAGIRGAIAVIRGVSAVAGIFRSAFNSAKSAVTSAVGAIMSFIRGIPGKIKGILTFDLSAAGRHIIQSFGKGIQAAGQAIYNKVKALASKIKGLLPGSPVKWGPLTAWNRGKAGIALMNLLAMGIKARQKHVVRQVKMTARAVDSAWNVPSLEDGFRMADDMNRVKASVSASVGAIVDNTTGPGAQEIVISNWQTGRGTMAEIADETLAARDFINAQNERMGV